MKRHNFKGQRATHGVKKVYITPILRNAEYLRFFEKPRLRQFGTETKGPGDPPNLRHNS